MLEVEWWAELRRERFVRGVPIKELVRRYGIDRNTVRRALRAVGDRSLFVVAGRAARAAGRKTMSAASQPQTTYSFTLFLRGPDVLDDEHFDALYEGGCDDALFGERDGAQYAAFDRHAASFSTALASAIAAVTSAVDGLSIVRIEPDELVTMAAIAERANLSRESIRLLSRGDRGPGGFPAPVAYADHRTRLWHWSDVAHWLAEHDKAKVEVDAEAADLVAAMNAAFGLREHAQHLRSKRDIALVTEALGDCPLARG